MDSAVGCSRSVSCVLYRKRWRFGHVAGKWQAGKLHEAPADPETASKRAEPRSVNERTALALHYRSQVGNRIECGMESRKTREAYPPQLHERDRSSQCRDGRGGVRHHLSPSLVQTLSALIRTNGSAS